MVGHKYDIRWLVQAAKGVIQGDNRTGKEESLGRVVYEQSVSLRRGWWLPWLLIAVGLAGLGGFIHPKALRLRGGGRIPLPPGVGLAIGMLGGAGLLAGGILALSDWAKGPRRARIEIRERGVALLTDYASRREVEVIPWSAIRTVERRSAGSSLTRVLVRVDGSAVELPPGLFRAERLLGAIEESVRLGVAAPEAAAFTSDVAAGRRVGRWARPAVLILAVAGGGMMPSVAWVPLAIGLAVTSWISWHAGVRPEVKREVWFSLVAGPLVGWLAVHALTLVREAVP